MIPHVSIVPSSILISYWMGGAFLMTVKRYAEVRHINDPGSLAKYRPSFLYYTEEKLLLLMMFFSLVSSFFLAIFLLKYKIELLLSFPFYACLFTWYAHLGMKPNSATQHPESLFRTEPYFVLYALFLAALTLFLFFINLPFLNFLLH